jgi:hypothetical protein
VAGSSRTNRALTERLLDNGGELLAEPFGAEALRLGDAVSGCEIGSVELLEHGAEGSRIGPIEEKAGLPFDNGFNEPTGAQRDHRPPRGLSLYGGDPEFFRRSDDHRLRPAEQSLGFVVADAAGEPNRRPREPLQAARVGAIPGDNERNPKATEGADNNLNPLVSDQLR